MTPMAWGISRMDLETALREAHSEAEQFPDGLAAEKLARAYAWLDRADEARRSFRQSADFIRTEVLDRGKREDSGMWLQYGTMLLKAGDEDAARAAFEHAQGLNDDRLDAGRATELRYRLGQPPVAEAQRGEHDQFVRALAARDLDALRAAREAAVRVTRKERTLPASNGVGATLYDLLEESFELEAELTGEPVPDHPGMLERAGLLKH